MNKTSLITSPYAQLTYLIPAGAFSVANETDVTGMHVLEHWLLEGGESFVGSEAVFKEARRLGGSISATVSRQSIKIELGYYSPLHVEAMKLMTDILGPHSFEENLFEAQKLDVTGELQDDPPIVALFDELYAKIFTGRYSFSGGGTLGAADTLTIADVTPLITAWRAAPGVMFWAGPAEHAPKILLGDGATAKQQLLIPELRATDGTGVCVQDAHTGLMTLDGPRGYTASSAGLAAYLQVQFGNQILVHTHVLPGYVLSAISFDRPALSGESIETAVHNFDELSDETKRPYLQLAAAKFADGYSYASGAARLQSQRWMNADFDAAVGELMKLLSTALEPRKHKS